MKTSQTGINLIKHYEKVRLDCYLDPSGHLTVGCGHLIAKKSNTGILFGKQVKKGALITEEQANQLLQQDLTAKESIVNKYVRQNLNQAQFDALVSFVFNGCDLANSTLLRKLNVGDYTGAAKEFEKWIYSDGKVLPGLQKRRKTEETLFSTGKLIFS